MDGAGLRAAARPRPRVTPQPPPPTHPPHDLLPMPHSMSAPLSHAADATTPRRTAVATGGLPRYLPPPRGHAAGASIAPSRARNPLPPHTWPRHECSREPRPTRAASESRASILERASRLQLDHVEGRHASITPPRSADLTIAQLTDLTIAQLTWLTASRTISKRSVLLCRARALRAAPSRARRRPPGR